MLTVIDTSVAIKWFVDEPGPGQDSALKVLDRIRRAPSEFAVPELFFNEMLAVLCRLESDPRQVSSYIGTLGELGFERFGNGARLLQEAAELALNYKISGYDAVFAASAKLLSGFWLTADDVAVRKLKGTGFVMALSSV